MREIIKINTVKEIRERIMETRYHALREDGWSKWHNFSEGDIRIALELETSKHLYYIMRVSGMSNGSEIFFLKLGKDERNIFETGSGFGNLLKDCTIGQLEDHLYEEIINELATQIKD